MPDHEFDNALGNKVRALMLEPSPAVWDAVAARLREKKRRRALLWWMSAAAVLTLSLGYWAMERNSGAGKPALPGTYSANRSADTRTVPAPSTVTDHPGERAAADLPEQSRSATRPSTGTSPEVLEDITTGKDVTSVKGAPDSTTTTEKNAGHSPIPAVNPDAQKDNRSLTSSSRKNTGSKKGAKVNREKHLFAAREGTAVAQENRTTGSPQTGTLRDLHAYLAFPMEPYNRAIDLRPPSAKKGQQQMTAAASPQKISRTKYRRWEYAFDVKAGMSSVQSGLFESFKSSTFEYQAANAAPTFTNNAFDNSLRFVQRQPSSVKAGPSLQAQLQVSRALSRKLRLGAGVQYMYQSSHVRFGAVVDSSAALVGNPQYLAARPPGGAIKTNDFSNQYHSVVVPVELSWNVDNKQHWYLNTGFSAGLLVGLDAFQYNAQSGYFYRDDNSFNRFQAGVFSGVYYKVNPQNKWQFSVGPTVQYQLNGLDKSVDARRMLFVGLGARIHFRTTR